MLQRALSIFVFLIVSLATFANNPKKVYVNYAINRIVDINYVQQTFEIDFYFQMYWETDSLFLQRSYALKENRKLQNGDIVDPAMLEWAPENDFTNALEIHPKQPVHYIYSDGYILYDSRYHGIFYNEMKLFDFPFDDQDLVITLEDFKKTKSEMVYCYGSPFEPAMHGDTISIDGHQAFETDLNFSEFHLNKDVKAIIDANVYEFTPDKDTFSRLRLVLNISREPGFYLTKVVSISIIIVMLSWVIFFMSPKKFTERASFGITAFLALTSHNFIINTLLPKISYLTTMDYFTLGTNILVCIPILETLIGRLIYVHSKKDDEFKIKRLVRIDYITFFLSAFMLAFLIFSFFKKLNP